jgi:hypothetical protein
MKSVSIFSNVEFVLIDATFFQFMTDVIRPMKIEEIMDQVS